MQQVTTEEGISTYDYDANGRGVKRSTPGGIERGNMITRMENGVSWTHTYNAENRLASLANGVTTWLFSYDGDGTLVGQLVTDNVTATHTAFFMGGGYEVISDGVTETVRKYYALAGSTFGMSDNGVMKYLISDHLGSSVAITDSTGELLAETRYMPFGEPRADVGSLAGTDKTYTGQRDVPDTGLMDYKARMYSTWLGRFIQPDTIVPGAGNSQAWNRYAYGLNNPVRYIDPSGHKACVDWDNNGQCVVDEDWQSNQGKKINKLSRDNYSPITASSVALEIATNSAEELSKYNNINITGSVPIELGGGSATLKYNYNSRIFSKLWAGLSVFGIVAQMYPAQLENFQQYGGFIPANELIADVIVDVGISFVSYTAGIAAGAVTGLLLSAAGVGTTTLIGIAVGATVGAGVSIGVSAALNNIVDRSNFRSQVSSSLYYFGYGAPIPQPQTSLSVPTPPLQIMSTPSPRK